MCFILTFFLDRHDRRPLDFSFIHDEHRRFSFENIHSSLL